MIIRFRSIWSSMFEVLNSRPSSGLSQSYSAMPRVRPDFDGTKRTKVVPPSLSHNKLIILTDSQSSETAAESIVGLEQAHREAIAQPLRCCTFSISLSLILCHVTEPEHHLAFQRIIYSSTSSCMQRVCDRYHACEDIPW